MSMGSNSGYAKLEKTRLNKPGGPTLYPGFRESVAAYFVEHGVSWWVGGDGPTESPISSQVACINHVEPARLRSELALNLARKHVRDAIEVLWPSGGGESRQR